MYIRSRRSDGFFFLFSFFFLFLFPFAFEFRSISTAATESNPGKREEKIKKKKRARRIPNSVTAEFYISSFVDLDLGLIFEEHDSGCFFFRPVSVLVTGWGFMNNQRLGKQRRRSRRRRTSRFRLGSRGCRLGLRRRKLDADGATSLLLHSWRRRPADWISRRRRRGRTTPLRLPHRRVRWIRPAKKKTDDRSFQFGLFKVLLGVFFFSPNRTTLMKQLGKMVSKRIKSTNISKIS